MYLHVLLAGSMCHGQADNIAAATTPVKKSKCFMCMDVNPWRSFAVSGKKWYNENLDQKLQVLCGSDSVTGAIKSASTGTCYGCLLEINNCYKVLTQFRDNLARLQQCKRGAKTPGDGDSNQNKATTWKRKPKPKKLFALPLASSTISADSLNLSAISPPDVSVINNISITKSSLQQSSLCVARKPPPSDINGDPPLDKENTTTMMSVSHSHVKPSKVY